MFDGTNALVSCTLHIICLENETIYTAPVKGREYINMQALYIQMQASLENIHFRSPKPRSCGSITLS